MPLSTGSWTITTDGLGTGTLTIASVDAAGNVAGSTTVPGTGPLVGAFDASAQTVNLANVTNPAQTFYVFSGALFQFTSGSSKTHTNATSVLAGTYEAYPPGVAPASTGRWVASLTAKVKEKDKEEKEKEQSKDTKDIKDRKDHKEQGKEVEKVPPDLASVPVPGALASDPSGQLQQLTLRVDALEAQLATGQAFIPAAERPDVGGQALQEGGGKQSEQG